ncbi:hypothetical protein QFC21_002295 [Naganishia friedmannii]|uniref:Uncharacterized protein n=1 Tax=Naganishia friedmannii TaxID=89922 RepID=A0ACC2VXE5_9TREE|nr:hypothetical protein QFC21_002295 [Naganishia friedmannii]
MSNPIEGYPEDAISRKCEDLFGYPPKRFQLEAAKALHAGRDVVVVSPTGSEKSLIERLPFLYSDIAKSSMLIIVSPLKALQKEQVTKDREAVCVNEETKTPALLKRINEKEARRIYMGPEQLRMNSINWKNPRGPSLSLD